MGNDMTITCDADVTRGLEALCARIPEFATIAPRVTPLPLRLRGEGFGALLKIILGQQVSVASADAVWRKLEAADLTEEGAVRAASSDALAACGLSRQKIRYAQLLAEARIDYAALRAMPPEAVIKTLTAVTGIGPWTAQIYVMFSLGHRDTFAPGDLALQEAARLIFDLPARPDPKTLATMAEDWAPWRAVAARLLWAYYAHATQREGI